MRRALLAAAPGLALGAVGVFHPAHLTYATAQRWTLVHVVGLAVFPLVGVALASVVSRRRDLLASVVAFACYGYACAYTALDVLAGIGAGFLTHRLGPDSARPREVHDLFAVAGRLGGVGAVCLLVAAVLVAVACWQEHGREALAPGLVLVVAGVSFLTSHIYPGRGVVTVLALGLATGWLSLPARAAGRPRRASGSGR